MTNARNLLAAFAVFLAVTPTLLHRPAAERGEEYFPGAVCLPWDRSFYVSLLRQGMDGRLWMENLYAVEPQREFLRPLWTLLGLGARLANADPDSAYVAWTIVLAALCVGCVLAFARALPLTRNERTFGVALALLGSGVSWLIPPATLGEWARIYRIIPPDRADVETNLFLVLAGHPQGAATVALLLASFLAVLRAHASRTLGSQALAAALAAALGFTHPHDLATLVGVLATWIALESFRGGGLRPAIHAAGGALFGAAVPALYHASLYFSDATYRDAFGVETLSPHPWSWVLAFAPLLPGALAAFPRLAASSPASRLLLAWVIAIPFLLYVPLPTQRRVVLGYLAALAFASAAGLAPLLGRLARARALKVPRWPAAALCLLLVSFSGTLETVFRLTREPFLDSRAYREPTSIHAALRWMSTGLPKDAIVLASFATSNRIPAIAGRRVYAGHGPGTPRHMEKIAQVRRFFVAETAAAWRTEFVRASRITHIVTSRDEPVDYPFGRTKATFDPRELPGARIVYDAADTLVVEVPR